MTTRAPRQRGAPSKSRLCRPKLAEARPAFAEAATAGGLRRASHAKAGGEDVCYFAHNERVAGSNPVRCIHLRTCSSAGEHLGRKPHSSIACSPASHTVPLRLTAGHRALDAKTVVRIHEREPASSSYERSDLERLLSPRRRGPESERANAFDGGEEVRYFGRAPAPYGVGGREFKSRRCHPAIVAQPPARAISASSVPRRTTNIHINQGRANGQAQHLQAQVEGPHP